MSEIGDVFAGDSSVSASKLDAKSFAVMTGTKIAALLSSQAIAAVIPTATAGGFTLNQPMFRKTDGTGWLAFFPKHLHVQDLDSDGGTYQNIRKANSQMIVISMVNDAFSSFYSEVSGTGAAVQTNTTTTLSNIQATSGTTNGGYASVFLSSVKISFVTPIFFSIKLNETPGTSLLCRGGIGIEKVQNTTDNTQKFGFEGCDANGTNFQLLEADGTARSMIDGLTAIATSTKTLKFTFTPGASTILQAGSGGTTATITNNCPNTGFIANENQLFRAGIKGTTTVARILNIFALQIYGKADSSDWF